MEKLQAALAKARNQRERRESNDYPRRHKANLPQTLTPAWESLERVELSDEVLRQHRIVSQEAGLDSGAFDMLRTKILLQMQQNGWSRLAVTSPGAACGKTTTACNLALGLGRQNSLRTMLFDFDLGDPSVHTVLGIERPHSLTDVLYGQVPIVDHVVRVRDNVGVVVSPEPDPDPTRLILSDRMGLFLETVQKDFKPDIMIFDLPALLSGDRARAFLKNADCALIVALAGRTRFNHLDICEREVSESTNVLGVVINGCHPSAMQQSNM